MKQYKWKIYYKIWFAVNLTWNGLDKYFFAVDAIPVAILIVDSVGNSARKICYSDYSKLHFPVHLRFSWTLHPLLPWQFRHLVALCSSKRSKIGAKWLEQWKCKIQTMQSKYRQIQPRRIWRPDFGVDKYTCRLDRHVIAWLGNFQVPNSEWKVRPHFGIGNRWRFWQHGCRFVRACEPHWEHQRLKKSIFLNSLMTKK